MKVTGLTGLTDLDVLHQRGDTLVLRARADDGGRVLVKTHASDLPTDASRERLRREHEATAAVDHPHLVGARDLVDLPTRVALVLDDPEGPTLAEAVEAGGLGLLDVLDVGVAVGRALAALHARGVVHRAVDGHHVVLTATGALLVDLYDATPAGLRPRRPGHGLHAAPEQQGPRPTPADPASDQLALAATLAQALDGLGLDPPPALAAVLERAAEAHPRQRYRSVLGLVGDLRWVRERLAAEGDCPPFPLDTDGPALRWEDPRHVVGRDEVREELRSVAAAVGADRVARVVVLRGAPGSGRTSVVRALCDDLAGRGILCGVATLDDPGAIVPFRSGAEVMEQFVDQLLTAPEPIVRAVQAELRQRLGPDLPVATQVLPALELLAGPQPEPRATSPEEAVARVGRATRAAVAALAEHMPPLVAVFDDGDLGDDTFLGALEAIGGHADVGAFLSVVVTGGRSARLEKVLGRMRGRGVAVHDLELPPLDRVALRHLVASGTGTAPDDVAELADAVWRRSGGSPRVALSDVWDLLDRGEIWVDVDAGRWRWSAAALQQETPPTLTEVAVHRVEALAPDVRAALDLVAVAGRAAGAPMVAEALDLTPLAAQAVVDRGAVAHVFARALDGSAAVACLDDGVRRAALDRLTPEARSALERTAARAVLAVADTDAAGRPDLSDGHRLEVIRLLAASAPVADDPATRQLYVTLCEDGARAAHRGGAFREALDLQRAAIAALGEWGWAEEPERTFELHLRAAENGLMVVQPEAVDDLLADAWAHGPTATQRVRAMRVLGMRAWTRQDHDGGLGELRGILDELGQPIPARPTWRDMAVELARTRAELGTTEPEAFLAAPRLTDERLVAALDAMLGCVHLAYVDQPLTHVLLVLRGTRLTARHGVSDASAYFLVGYGMLSISGPVGTERGLRFGRVGMALAERGGTNTTMVGFAYDAFVRHWGEPLDATVDPLRHRYQDSLATRTRGYGLTGGTFAVLHALLAGRPLRAVEADASTVAADLGRLGETAFQARVDVVGQAVSDLRRGLADGVLDGPTFSSTAWLAAKPRRGEMAVIVHTLRALVALAHGRDEVAAEAVAAAAPLLRTAPGQAVVGLHRFQAALLAAASVAAAPGPAERARRRVRVERALVPLRRMARHAPANTAHRVALVEAVLAEADGGDRRGTRAMERYEEAVRLATEHGALCDLGLAAERAARFHHVRGRAQLARHYATAALDAWQAWGADAVAAAHTDRLPGVGALGGRPLTRPTSGADPGRVPDRPADTVAAETLAEASRLLGQELEVREFLERMVEILMRHAGASRGFLVLSSARGPVVEVAAEVVDGAVQVTPLPSPDPADHPHLSLQAMNYVLRTRQVLVLVDPADDRRFRADTALRDRAPRALLGLPLGRATGTTGAFVFESDAAPHGVESERVEALRVLSAQAIAAIDHARLSSDLSSLSRDVADLRSTAETLSARAETDPLTGVANRLGLESALRAAMGGDDATDAAGSGGPDGPGAPGGPGGGPRVGVLFCDLDDFKVVNDTWGHAAGDTALVEVARRLRAVVRADDVVARLGGDEFVVVSFGVSDEELARVAERARESVGRPIEVAGAGPLSVGVSIGVGRADLVGVTSVDDVDTLMELADDSMYRAKRAGKNRVEMS
ncbi:MAG TPA: diguanylate cyclase [Acidimicrobiales bacterium]|nr:diguanylate cyclase [Acidimicrobiales bacterium]